MKKVTYQGVPGAYSQSAAKKFFGDEIDTIATHSFEDALNSAEEEGISTDVNYSILPVENSIEGTVGQSVDEIVLKKLKLSCKKPDLKDWKKVVEAHTNPKSEVTIAMVGKYMELKDAYKSLNEALIHGGIQHELKTNIKYVKSIF